MVDTGTQTRENPLRKLALATMRGEATGYAAGIPVDEDGLFASYDKNTFDRLYPRFLEETSQAATDDGQGTFGILPGVGRTDKKLVDPRKFPLKHCNIVNLGGDFIHFYVWTDRCASANFVSAKALSTLRLKSDATKAQNFSTVAGSVTVSQVARLEWKGREKVCKSNFYVIPTEEEGMDLIVGRDFLDKFGDDVFEDLDTAAVTVATPASKNETIAQRELEADAQAKAAMLDKKRNERKVIPGREKEGGSVRSGPRR